MNPTRFATSALCILAARTAISPGSRALASQARQFCHHNTEGGFASRLHTLVQSKAPDFTADAVFGNDTIEKLQLSSFKGKYVLLFFYPLDFTFVCPSEIIAFNERLEEFKSRNCEVIGVSVDSHFCHLAWRKTPREKGGIGNIQYPLVSDLSKEISSNYGVLTQDRTVSLRGLFLIDKEGVVRHSLVNDLPIGRSVEEAIRVLDALQHIEKAGEVCPADWKKGSKAMKATAEGVVEYFASR